MKMKMIFGVSLMLVLLITFTVEAKKTNTLEPIEQLGKVLFFDKISSPGSMSCADCHGPSVGWTGPIAGNNVHGAV
jgi:cytochrome c peroxidase